MYSNTFKKGRLYKQCMVHQASLKWIFKKCHVFVYFLQAFAINPLLPSMTVVDSRLSFLADTATGLMFYDTKDVCATYQFRHLLIVHSIHTRILDQYLTLQQSFHPPNWLIVFQSDSFLILINCRYNLPEEIFYKFYDVVLSF